MTLETMRRLNEMQFSGSFQIKEFDDMIKFSTTVQAQAKRQIKLEFLYAIGSAVLEFGQYVPVLSGGLRSEIKTLLFHIDSSIASLQGKAKSFAGRLDAESMTESLIATGGQRKPQAIQDKVYKDKKDQAITYYHLGVPYSSRREWRAIIQQTEHDEDYTPYQKSILSINAATGGLYIEHGFAETPDEVYAAFVELFEMLEVLMDTMTDDMLDRLDERQTALKTKPLSIFLTFGAL